MKHPNPERLVVTDGIPITVHSAREGEEGGKEERGRREGGVRAGQGIKPHCCTCTED